MTMTHDMAGLRGGGSDLMNNVFNLSCVILIFCVENYPTGAYFHPPKTTKETIQLSAIHKIIIKQFHPSSIGMLSFESACFHRQGSISRSPCQQ